MSDVGWGSDHLEPPKKRKIPFWVMGCAGGCMFAIGAAAVTAWFAVPKAKEWLAKQTNPEVQWPQLAAVLPFDEQPPGFTIAHWPMPIPDVWQLESKAQDLIVYVLAAPERSGKAWGEWFTAPKKAPMLANQEGDLESSESTLVLQGRELRCVRFTRTGLSETTEPLAPPTPEPPAPPEHAQPGKRDRLGGALGVFERSAMYRGSGLALDVTPEGSDDRVLIWMVRGKAGATVSDDEAKAILAPFHIGPAH